MVGSEVPESCVLSTPHSSVAIGRGGDIGNVCASDSMLFVPELDGDPTGSCYCLLGLDEGIKVSSG